MGEKVSNYLWFGGIILGTLLLKKPAAMLLARLSNGLTEHFSNARHHHTMHSMVRKPLERLLQTVLYYIAINQLSALLDHFVLHHYTGKKSEVNIRLGDVVDHIFLFLFIVFFGQVVSRVIDFIYQLRMDKAQHEENRSQQQLLPLVKEMGKLFLWTLCVFWILGSVFHVNVPALITGLGIGGVAIALAGKTTVENLFAAFTILTDKPFQTGEIIRLGDLEGTVERIGFRSTRLRGADGSAYVVPNQNLVGNNLINLTQRDTRGLKVIINIKYGVAHEALQQMIADIKKTLQNTPPLIAPLEVILESFGEDTFQIMVNYHLPTPLPEGNTLADIKQNVNLKIYEIVTRYTDEKKASVQDN